MSVRVQRSEDRWGLLRMGLPFMLDLPRLNVFSLVVLGECVAPDLKLAPFAIAALADLCNAL